MGSTKRDMSMIGRVFGQLTVVGPAKERGTENEYKWICRCSCGKTTTASTSALRSGATTSCGHVALRKSADNLKFSEYRHRRHLNDRPPSTNSTGYRNISRTVKKGKPMYRVAVVYDHHQYGGFRETLEEALELREKMRKRYWPEYDPQAKRSQVHEKPVVVKDHQGKEFASLRSMLDTYRLSKRLYRSRLKRGLPLKKTLTNPIGRSGKRPEPVKDHNGVAYPSYKKMAEAYHISAELLATRLHRGWSLEKALKTPVKKISKRGHND